MFRSDFLFSLSANQRETEFNLNSARKKWTRRHHLVGANFRCLLRARAQQKMSKWGRIHFIDTWNNERPERYSVPKDLVLGIWIQYSRPSLRCSTGNSPPPPASQPATGVVLSIGSSVERNRHWGHVLAVTIISECLTVTVGLFGRVGGPDPLPPDTTGWLDEWMNEWLSDRIEVAVSNPVATAHEPRIFRFAN